MLRLTKWDSSSTRIPDGWEIGCILIVCSLFYWLPGLSSQPRTERSSMTTRRPIPAWGWHGSPMREPRAPRWVTRFVWRERRGKSLRSRFAFGTTERYPAHLTRDSEFGLWTQPT